MPDTAPPLDAPSPSPAPNQSSASTSDTKRLGIAWTKRNRLIAASIGGVLILGSAVLALGYYWPTGTDVSSNVPSPTSTPTPTSTPLPKDQPDPLNGMLYTATEAAAFAHLSPMAVMVENHVDARPQSGLNQAEVLYEAMAEGGITRFMAVYLAHQPTKIGPVRSARLHFVNWASEYHGSYAHWGGSAEALGYLTSHSNPKNLDEFSFASAFYRDTSSGKSLEHTGYTSISSLRAVAQRQGWEADPSFAPWTFKDDVPTESRPDSQIVKLGFLGAIGYDARFEYQPATNDYLRWTGGQPHIDALDGSQLEAKTIVLQFQQVTNYTDANGHAAVRVTTTGSGKAVVIEDGTSNEGTWTKNSDTDRTVFADSTGKPMALNRGKVWVISVPIGSSVSY